MKSCKGILTFIICLLTSSLVIGQNSVSGMVTDSDSGEALIGVNILVEGTVSGTITNFDGTYELSSEQELPITLVYSLIGYETVRRVITTDGQTENLTLSSQAILADEIVVSASRVEESILASPVTVEKLDLLALKQSASADYYDEVTRLKGVHHNQASLTFNSINARGFSAHGNTRFIQLQDGIDNAAPLLNFPTGNIVGISELDIKNVELLPGAGSALYGPNAFNGILLMTSKDPFTYQGLSASIKTGVTDGSVVDPFYGASVRYAKSFNDKFAFKFNLSSFFAKDWDANDYETHRSPSILGERNPGDTDFDGLNLYGDETLITSALTGLPFALKRTGIREADLLNNRDAKSLKAGAAVHYRLNDNLEANASYQWGSGSAIYQGSERYGLRNFVQSFMKLELNSNKWNIRAYSSVTDAGDSYNMTALGAFANEAMFPSVVRDPNSGAVIGGWVASFSQAYNGAFGVFGIPGGDVDGARAFADAGGLGALNEASRQAFKANVIGQGASPEYAETVLQAFTGQRVRDADGNLTPEAIAAIEAVRNGLFQQGGAGFIDDSRLNHIEANYNLSSLFNDAIGFQVGGNYRQYSLFTNGTVFNEDPDGDGIFERIKIGEYGAYMQASKALGNLKLQGSLRYDKNDNFDGQITPRLSAVYSIGEAKNHNIRVSYQTGFRNPTNQGQYIYFPTTNILLGGTRDNAERYGIFEGGAWSEASYLEYLASVASGNPDESLLKEQYLDYVKPEQLQTFEIGYKGITNKKFFLDVSLYYNTYSNFITQNNVISKEDTFHKGELLPAGTTWRPYFNAPVDFNSYGVSTSMEYLLPNNWKIVGNYTFNDFKLPEELPVGFEAYDPGFNTPTSKVNLGVQNRKFLNKFSAGLNMRYQNEHYFFSSFGEDIIPSFMVLDAQVGYKWDAAKSTVKLGVNNLLKENYRTNYGAPFIGRMVHLTITYDQFSN